jgi:hypothetical protein
VLGGLALDKEFSKKIFRRVSGASTLGKKFSKKKENFFAECQVSGHSAKNFFKKILCRVPDAWALGIEFSKKNFAECQKPGHSA